MTTIHTKPDGSPDWSAVIGESDEYTGGMMRSAYTAALERCAGFAATFQPTLEHPEAWKPHIHAMACSEAGMRNAISDEIRRWIEEEGKGKMNEKAVPVKMTDEMKRKLGGWGPTLDEMWAKALAAAPAKPEDGK